MTDERESFESAEQSEPEIERHVNAIVAIIAGARRELLAVMGAINVDHLTRAEQQAAIRRVNAILADLDRDLTARVSEAIDDVYEHGRARALVSLGLYADIGAARRFLRSDKAVTSRAHRVFKEAVVDTAMDDLLAMTQNTRRRVKAEVRRVAADVFRTDESVPSQRRQMSRRLKDAGIFAIRDRAGRRWKIDRYAEVVVTTKMAEAHREATDQEAREQGAGYVVVSRHSGACRKCKPWEGRVLRLSADVEGDQPTLEEAMRGGLFHVACAHTVTAIRDPALMRL